MLVNKPRWNQLLSLCLVSSVLVTIELIELTCDYNKLSINIPIYLFTVGLMCIVYS